MHSHSVVSLLQVVVTVTRILSFSEDDSSSGKAQAKAILDALHEWNLDQVQIMCCDITSSNTKHLHGACVLLEQRHEREPLLFAC